jgi:hypothetical protein
MDREFATKMHKETEREEIAEIAEISFRGGQKEDL